MKPVVSAMLVGVTLISLALLATACNDSARRGQAAQVIPVTATTTAAAIPATAETPAAEAAEPQAAQPVQPDQAGQPIAPVNASGPLAGSYGYYVGMFVAEKMDEKKNPMESNKINVSIDSIDGAKVTGHSVVAGTSTPFTGTLKPAKAKGKYDLTLTEAAGQDSGVFTAVLDPAIKTLSGTWVANNRQAAVTERSYELVKTQFKYNPKQELGNTWVELYDGQQPGRERYESITDAAGKLNASVRLLKSKDVDNMYKRDLEVMRNAVYARHGYTFRNRQMRYFFDNYIDWYVPVKTDVTADLTDLENRNIALIKRYEKHADKYYDSYGR